MGFGGTASFDVGLVTLFEIDFAQIVTESVSVSELTAKLDELVTEQAQALVWVNGIMTVNKTAPMMAVS